VERLGFRASDVRHIVVTHLDLDHAGGLADFPAAQVHVMAAELEAARAPATRLFRERYGAVASGDLARWNSYEADGEPWHGFASVRALKGLPPEILLVPLAGHSPGHAGVAMRTADGWLLHAGDAYFHPREMDPAHPRCTPVLAAFQSIMQVDRGARLHNQARLRELARTNPEVKIFCSHDPDDFERFAPTSGARTT
jgi:glyoxylase-like metal-dependent hydrolase (beta-lactamase superfamily II)